MDTIETIRHDSAPGLMARIVDDPHADNPLDFAAGYGAHEVGTVGAVSPRSNLFTRDSDPAAIECPDCEGSGATDDDDTCTACEGYGTRTARSSREWCQDRGPDAIAAVPIRGNLATSQPWISALDWEAAEDAQSVIYVRSKADHSDDDRAEIARNLESDLQDGYNEYLQYGAFGVIVEPDPDSDDPAPERPDYPAVFGHYGGTDDPAYEYLEEAAEMADRERKEAAEMAARGIVTRC